VDFAEQNRRDLRQQGFSPDQARKLGYTAAPFQALTESVGNLFGLGKLPAVNRFLSRFTKPITFGQGAFGRYLVNTSIQGGVQFSEEQLQDNFVIPAVQELFVAMEADMPEVDWSDYRNRAIESSPELGATLLPMVLLFGGRATVRDVRLSKQMTTSPRMLELAGFDAQQALDIQSQASEADRIAKAQELWTQRAGTPQSIEAAATVLAQEQKQEQDAAFNALNELEAGGALPRLGRTGQGWHITLPTDGTRMEFANYSETEAARWRWAREQGLELGETLTQTAENFRRVQTAKSQTGSDSGNETVSDSLTSQTAEEERLPAAAQTRNIQLRAASEPQRQQEFELQRPVIHSIDNLLYGTETQTQTGDSLRLRDELLEGAARHSGGNVGPSRPDEGAAGRAGTEVGGGKGRRQGAGQQAVSPKEARRRLIEWARDHGRLLTTLPAQWVRGGPNDRAGKEHHVFPFSAGTGRWIKITKGNGAHFGLWPRDQGRDWALEPRGSIGDYLRRLQRANQKLGQDIILHGVLQDQQSGAISIITSQRHIQETQETTEQDVIEAMQTQGFEQAGNAATFYRESDNLAIFDAHLGNVARVNDTLEAFDVIAMHPEGRLRQYLQQAVEERRNAEKSENPQTPSSLPAGVDVYPVDGAPGDSSEALNADDWFLNLPPRGSFGGELYDKSQLDSLEQELAAHGVELMRDADEFLASVRGGIGAGFQAKGPGKGEMYLKSNATVREVLHEMIHFRQFRDLGYEGYLKLRESGRHEMGVMEWFNQHPDEWKRLNADEQLTELKNHDFWKVHFGQWKKAPRL